MGIVIHTIVLLVSGGIGGLTIGKILPKLSLGNICDFAAGSLGGFVIGLVFSSFGIAVSTADDFNVACMFLYALCGAIAVMVVAGVTKLFGEE